SSFVFFFNDTATTEIYTLSLHDALPIYFPLLFTACVRLIISNAHRSRLAKRSEEHTSELQSLTNLVCRLLLEKKQYERVVHQQSEHKGKSAECNHRVRAV